MANYHESRTASWGHWGIDLMEPNPNRSQNYGIIVGHISFPVGTRGPNDLSRRAEYRAMIDAWISEGVMPECATPATRH